MTLPIVALILENMLDSVLNKNSLPQSVATSQDTE